MKCIVVGAGAWGLPAGAELARRGHDVIVLDRFGVSNPFSSSSGTSRLWRTMDPDPAVVRRARRSVEAMEDLAVRTGRTLFLRRGLLWRDDVSLERVARTLSTADIDSREIGARDVGTVLPGLRPDGRDAIWQPDAGVILAEEMLAAQLSVLERHGGRLEQGRHVVRIDESGGRFRVACASGEEYHADAVVVAAGPFTPSLLPSLGVDIPLRPYLEQVVHFGNASALSATDHLTCFFDGPRGEEPGIYCMPVPGGGYKVGLDRPLGAFDPGDPDRTPDDARTRHLAHRVARDLTGVTPNVLSAQVCAWTDSPDGKFIVDTLRDGLVLACGDSGEGFKFSALMGTILADLVEGRTLDPDDAALGLSRFSGGYPDAPQGATALGRH